MEVIGIGLMFLLIVIPLALIIGGSRRKRVSIYSENYKGPRVSYNGEVGGCSGGLCIASRENTLTGGFNEAYRAEHAAERQQYFEDMARSSSSREDGKEPGNAPMGNALARQESQAETQRVTREEYPTVVEKTSTGPAVVHVRIGRG